MENIIVSIPIAAVSAAVSVGVIKGFEAFFSRRASAKARNGLASGNGSTPGNGSTKKFDPETIPGLSEVCQLRGERLTKVETRLVRGEEDIKEIKGDVKEILRRVK